jgi:hypothetical protein
MSASTCDRKKKRDNESSEKAETGYSYIMKLVY